MTGEEDAPRDPGELTEEQAGRMLAEMNEVIRAGEEMRKLRGEMIQLFVGFGWTQDRIARLTGMSQPAVSKQVAKDRAGEPPHPPGLSLGQCDGPWLEGRLWGLAEEISEALDGEARCTRFVHALLRGRERFTPRSVDELRRLVEEDLRGRPGKVPGGCRDAYDEISRGFDVPSAAAPGVPPPSGSASVRRALARRIQRDRLTRGVRDRQGPPAADR
ncbi:sigma-70 family RNA polymerase sigma factor [Streptomyces sp. NPDC058622]|uniref:sigma-70 family RNA polymerase sigma factor n=1 Tax=unclassified Streptomyces TaxID=2593676 RepID=UPI003652A9C4